MLIVVQFVLTPQPELAVDRLQVVSDRMRAEPELRSDRGDPRAVSKQVHEFPFARRRAVGFLDEAVKHDDAFANKGAEKYPGYAFRAFEPQLEKPFTECFGVRLSKVGGQGPPSGA